MRDFYCGDVNEQHVDQVVTLVGWVHRCRNHGGVMFIDLRDREGMVQVVVDPQNNEGSVHEVRHESVVQVKGIVRLRPDQGKGLKGTEAVEVHAQSLTVISEAESLPLQVSDLRETGEETRLRYRYLDLRRPVMSARLKQRAHLISSVRRYLEAHGYLDIETPVLTKATPEGARDYLVPSRTQKGAFFALPQSPQIFKQLLMVSGFDRYYQVVRCFRDEDLRADRQPEFTQIDIEASFVEEEDILSLTEGLLRQVFQDVLSVTLPDPFPRMTYEEAMRRFGSDKPDLRIPFELVDVADLVKDTAFRVFSEPAQRQEGRVAALCVNDGASFSRKRIDALTEFAKIYGAKGLAYIKVNALEEGVSGLQSPLLKALPESVVSDLLSRVQAKNGDIVFFAADQKAVVNDVLGALRVKLGHELGAVKGEWAPLWVTHFPMFESVKGRLQAMHHPFTAPDASYDELKACTDPLALSARAYDIVLNGYEIGGGSIRTHQRAMLAEVFSLMGIDETLAEEKFGFLLDAFRYGAPPHGGIALGVDRIVMLMTATDNIRDVIAFPKTQTASCLLTDAPSSASVEQLVELGIRVAPTAQ